MKCPICNEEEFLKEVFKNNSAVFDNSSMYEEINIFQCEFCGHVFNKLSEKEIKNLDTYYKKESCNVNINSKNKTADLPGSNSVLSNQRYDKVYDFIKDTIKYDDTILDVGCAKGGFLNYLKNKSYYNLSGNEFVKTYLDNFENKEQYDIRKEKVENLSYKDDSFDFVMLDQVLEHVFDIRLAIQKIKKVLKKDGYLCIGVPDIERYKDYNFFDYYWFILKEHIHHFSLASLNTLLYSEGFEFEKVELLETSIMNDQMKLPNMLVMYKLVDKEVSVVFEGNRKKIETTSVYLQEYLGLCIKDAIDRNNKFIKELDKKELTIYVWGVGKECFYLINNSPLKYYKDRIVFIDKNEYKQNNLTLQGKRIYSEKDIDFTNRNSSVVITAVTYKEEIEKYLKENNYKGSILCA